MTIALSDAQQRALLAMPMNGPYGAEGYGWCRQPGEIAQLAGKHVPRRTIEILVERGYAAWGGPARQLVQLTPSGREQRFKIWKVRK